MNANLLTPHIANASRRHDIRAVAPIRDVAPRAGRRTAMAYIACEIPEGMRLDAWKAATAPRKRSWRLAGFRVRPLSALDAKTR
jgi:hypothetical protein